MNAEEQALADEIYQALMDYSNKSERSQQAAEFKLGISDIGYCPERNRRLMDHQVPEDTDALAAFIGTAIGDHAEKAVAKHLWPDAMIQPEVHLDVRVQGQSYRLPGHPDIVDPGNLRVLDCKTDYGLNEITNMGSTFSQKWQRNAYGLASFQEGLFAGADLADIKVGNFWIDRTGRSKRVQVELTPIDLDVIQEGMMEIDSTVYAFLNGEEAEKRPPRQVCEVTCGFWRTCRQYDTDVHGLLDDPNIVFNVISYFEGNQLEKQGALMKDEAKEHLRDISGSTGEHMLRWIWVNATEKRAGYYRIEVKKIDKGKVVPG